MLHLASLFLALGSFGSPTAAAVVYVDDDALPGGDGTSWASAFDDLQLALGAAREGDEVWVAAGRYRPSAGDPLVSFTLPDGVSVYGGFAGTEAVREERDPAVNVAVLDGDLLGNDLPDFGNYDDNSLHVVVAPAFDRAHLDGLTVRGGRSGRGGAIQLGARRASLANLVITENRTFGGGNEGAGVWLVGNEASIRDCRFVGNRATAGAGLMLRNTTEVTVTGCVFERNQATSGAAIAVEGVVVGTVKVLDCAFRDNTGTAGAGIYATPEAFTGVSVERCTFERQAVTTGAGLYVYAAFPGAVFVADSLFRDNAAGAGGGIALGGEQPVPARIERCRFESNLACSGGGLFLQNATVNVVACEFRENHRPTNCGVGSGGGAIRADAATVTVAIERSLFLDSDHALVLGERSSNFTAVLSTFVNATVESPAFVLTHTTSLDLDSCIVWGGADEQIDAGTNAVVTAVHSDVRMGGAGLPGTGNLDVDPGFVDLAGGDLRLTPSSPCVDAGRPHLVVVASDLDRDSRLVDGDLDGRAVVDMGADEHSPLHLEVLGLPAPGETLTFVTSGPPGFQAYLFVSTPGQHHVPGIGTLFLDPGSPHLGVHSWSAPSSIPAVVPPSALGHLFHFQEVALSPGARLVSNYVPLQF